MNMHGSAMPADLLEMSSHGHLKAEGEQNAVVIWCLTAPVRLRQPTDVLASIPAAVPNLSTTT
jgi:hypothetical protein